MKINLRGKRTYAEFQEAYFEFTKNLVETCFRLVTWCVLLGVLKYLSEKSSSNFLWGVYVGLNVLLLFYISVFFNERFEITIFELDSASKRWQWWLEFGTNLILSFGLLMFCNIVIAQLVVTIATLQGMQ